MSARAQELLAWCALALSVAGCVLVDVVTR